MVARREWTKQWWSRAHGRDELVMSEAVLNELGRGGHPRRHECLALASHYRCDFLATWNCGHLANASKFDHIRRVNGILGLFVPLLVTPLELLTRSVSE